MIPLTTARLVDDDGTGAEIVRLDTATLGVVLNSLDIGYPEVRSAATNLPGQDGTLDTTAYIGSRGIVATVTLPASGFYAVEDQLRGVMHPANRYYLYTLRDGWTDELRILVRGAAFTPTLAWPKTAQLSWVAPTGTFEGPVSTVTLNPTISGAEGGIVTPVAFPVSFDPGLNPGASVVVVGGNAATTTVTANIYGPCTNPALFLAATQQILAFNVTLAGGDFLHIDFAARTVNLNGLPAQSRYGVLDFTRSTWWALPPGTQQIAFNPTSASGGAQAVLTWRPRYI